MLLCYFVCCGTFAPGTALRAAEAAGNAEKLVLDTFGYWRCHITLQPTVFGTQKDAKPDKIATFHTSFRKPVLPEDQPATPFPPAHWMQPDFDDATWWRQPGPFFGGELLRAGWQMEAFSRYGSAQPPSIALICLRGKFAVTDPAQVHSLKLSLAFRGGVVIYINGHEIARRYLPGGEISFETLADDYPWEAWVQANGEYRYLFWSGGREGVEVRERRAENIEIPARLLRKGVNVLAIEIHRAAQHPNTLTHRPGADRNRLWNTVGFIEAKASAVGDGVVPNVGRPPGLRAWNANPLESVFECTYGDPNEPMKPVRVVGARNGSFSGQLVIGSDKPIHALRAEVTELRHEKGLATIGGTTIQIRYPRATTKERGAKYVHRVLGGWGGFHSLRFDALQNEPPTEVPIQQIGNQWKNLYPDAKWLGAVQPIWLTVQVPPDAAPGTYRGTLTVRTEGAEPIIAPVELEVHDYLLPSPADFQTSVGFLQFPESLADHYKVPLWSEEHWKLIECSMRLLARIGNRALFVPFICRTHFRNKESMVRWIRNGETYEHDFSLMERYLDTALKAGNRPKIICFQIWDYHIGSNPKTKIGTGLYGQSWLAEQRPVPVSQLDPQNGRLQEMAGPRYTDAEAESFWKPVAEGALKVLKARGLEGTAMLGICGDYIPVKETVDLWAKLLPGAPWITMGHGITPNLYGQRIGYATAVFIAYFSDPAISRRYGWQRPDHTAYFPRYADARATFGMSYERTFFEFGLLCGLRGAGRQSLDDFHDYNVRSGWGSDCCWGSLTPGPAWLAPGEKAPISTERYEMGLEGVQECEVRIFLEKALTDEKLRAKLGDKLAARCQAILDERTRFLAWGNEQNTNGILHTYLPYGPLGSDWYACGTDWQGRSAKLYAAAAEAAAALAR